MKQLLSFSHNWNGKLLCRYFTTLRLSGRFEVGETVDVYLRTESLGDAEVVSKKSLTALQLNDFISGLDTGYTPDETRAILKKMYPDVKNWDTQVIYLYLLRYTDLKRVNERINAAASARQKEVQP